MKNRCIIDQLGLSEIDKRVFIDCDDYVDVELDDNLYVGANSDCSEIVVHTCNKTLLYIDCLEYSERMTITVPIAMGKDNYRNDYELIVDLNKEGRNDYWRLQDDRTADLLSHEDRYDIKVDDIVDTIETTMKSSEDIPNGIDIEKISSLVGRAIRPLLNNYLKKDNVLCKRK